MNNYPEFVEVDGKRYKINTDFKIALECNKVSMDENIGGFERALAIIELLFGDEALDDGLSNPDLYMKLTELAKKYLLCGQEFKKTKEKPDMDFIKDYSYIKTSFRSDYGIKLDEEKLHWWEFMELMNELSNSELGNCCILNKIRNIRTYDLKSISDEKTRNRMREAQEYFSLDKKEDKRKKMSDAQKESADKFNQIFGL